MKNMMVPCTPETEASIALSFSFSYVQLVTQQYESVEKHLCNHDSHYEKYAWFLITQK